MFSFLYEVIVLNLSKAFTCVGVYVYVYACFFFFNILACARKNPVYSVFCPTTPPLHPGQGRDDNIEWKCQEHLKEVQFFIVAVFFFFSLLLIYFPGENITEILLLFHLFYTKHEFLDGGGEREWYFLVNSKARITPVSLTVRRSNQLILEEINSEYSLQGLMLKLQCFGYLTQRADSLKKTLMLERLKAGGERGDRLR